MFTPLRILAMTLALAGVIVFLVRDDKSSTLLLFSAVVVAGFEHHRLKKLSRNDG